jgi:hypothetical protein
MRQALYQALECKTRALSAWVLEQLLGRHDTYFRLFAENQVVYLNMTIAEDVRLLQIKLLLVEAAIPPKRNLMCSATHATAQFLANNVGAAVLSSRAGRIQLAGYGCSSIH